MLPRLLRPHCFACDFFREIRAIRGQKHNRIFTTDNADESHQLEKGCYGPESQCFRVLAPESQKGTFYFSE